MIKSKKGQMFTLLALLVIALMFLSFELFSFIHERNVIEARVSSMDSFIKSTEDNLEKQVYISGFRILFLAEKYIEEELNYIGQDGHYAGIEEFFEEAFIDGTVNGVKESILLTYDEDGNPSDNLRQSLTNNAARINVDVTIPDNITADDITVSQDDPWNVKFSISFNLRVEDREGLARWDRLQTVDAYIPITYFTDPVFTVETSRWVPRLITANPGNPSADLVGHIVGEYYISNPDAPNFLHRFEGNLDAQDVDSGIESIVDLSDIPGQISHIINIGESCVDHEYFDGDVDSGSTVGIYDSWLRIDAGHLGSYT